MSCLHNESILESIYDEVLEELEAKEQFRPLFTQEEIEKAYHEIIENIEGKAPQVKPASVQKDPILKQPKKVEGVMYS